MSIIDQCPFCGSHDITETPGHACDGIFGIDEVWHGDPVIRAKCNDCGKDLPMPEDAN